MTDSISRRHFFSRIGEVSSRAFEALRGSEAAGQAPARENPFPGQLYWDPISSQWKSAFGVDLLGRILPSYDHEECVLTVLGEPPRRTAVWNFQIGDWALPLAGQDVQSRTVVGRKLVRECYKLRSEVPPALKLHQEMREKFPDLDISKAFIIGKTKAFDGDSHYYPEDLITVIFKNEIPDMALQERFQVQAFVQAVRPQIYMLKCFLSSQKLQLKFMMDSTAPEEAPPVALPSHFLGISRTETFLADGSKSPLRDYNFYASNEDIREYCQEMGLAYPLNLFNLDRDIQIFGVTYHSESLKIQKIKRYYMWWLP